jgi:FKBP-type peptidyl-prolyl cis-trans isomerase FklB
MHRRFLSSIVALCLAAGPAFGQEEAPPAKAAKTKAVPKTATKAPPGLEDVKSQASYAIGVNIGRDLARVASECDIELLVQGLRDALAKKKPVLTDDQMQEALTSFSKEVQTKAEEKNKNEGAAFLAENKKKKGVMTTKTGLQYKVLKAGEGDSPKKTNVVKVHYHGTLTDGTVFDSSVERDEPAEFPVDRVIPGWTEALLAMKVGDKWQIVIPSELGYGAQGNGPIPPHAVLVFDVELLEIVK